jgi:hypothetical protein
MKKILGLLLLLVSFASYGQFTNYTNINGRYKWIAGKFDSTFTLPSGTTPSLRTGGGTGPGALFYSTTDSSVYQYTGSQWSRLRGTDTAHVISAYVRNTTGSILTPGQVVYINGSTGTTPTVALAYNKQDSTSAMTFGFVRGNIAVNGFGYITTFGPLEGVNTNAYTEGEVIYLDSIPGQFTHDKPQAPYHMVTLGYIIKKSGGNGTIYAKIQNGYELEELHNVRITAPVLNKSVIIYDSVRALWVDTTVSAAGLGLGGSGTTNYLSKWTSSSALGNSLVFDNGTNVGIGTATPTSAKLQIDAGSSTSITSLTSNTEVGQYFSSAGFSVFRVVSPTNNVPVIALNTSSSVGTYNVGQQRAFFAYYGDAAGYASIGIQSGTHAIVIRTNNGNVILGGGTTDAGYKLDVAGTFRSTLDANINGLTVGKGGGQLATNTAVGFEALNATNTGGNNVAIGYRALKAYTGDSNVAIGTNALTANTTGNTNVGIGSGAGQAITTANKNTLVGYAAGSSNVSSHGNTYIGYYAGVSATANANTLVGSEAGYNMSTAAGNTFVGNAAGRAVTTGGTNTLVGYFSGYALSTGSENVLIGNNIMASASTASQNTIVGSYAGNQLTGNANAYFGWYAGVSATSSIYNTGIGYGALQNIITGSNNTAIGYRAGRFFGAATSSNTTGANGIFVGYLSRASADGNTNETVIGYDLIGNGSNTVTIGNSSVTATYLGGSVSTSQPSATGAGKWKLGKKISATVALVTTDYIEVDIDGVVYKLALVN